MTAQDARRQIVDRMGILERGAPLKLDLGCGQTKRAADFVGVDVLDSPAVDIVGDVLEVLQRLNDETVTEVFSAHLFEHLDDALAVIDELERVLVIGGRLTVVVPHFSNAYFYSDPTHRRPFGLYSFSYVADDPLFARRVPHYGHVPRLRLDDVLLGFRSEAPFYGRRRIRELFGRLVDRSVWLQEFYEENLTGLISCYEIEFRLLKVR